MKMNFLILLIIIYSTECRNVKSSHRNVNKTLLMGHNNMMTPIISDKLVFDTRNLDEDELEFFLNLDSDDTLQELSDFESSERISAKRTPQRRQRSRNRASRQKDTNFATVAPKPTVSPLPDNHVGAGDGSESDVGPKPVETLRHDVPPKPVEALRHDNEVHPKPAEALRHDNDVPPKPVETYRHEAHPTLYVPTEVKPIVATKPVMEGPIVMDKGWIQYKYDKSFMLMNVTANRYDAERICETFNKNVDIGAELAVPQTEDEMHFLYYYLFSLSRAMKNVWIGQNTENYRNASIDYMLYANWAKGMPTLTKPCIQIRSPYTIYADMDGNVGGKWEDVSCYRKNLVLCQKPQHWSEHQFIRILTDLKKDVEGFKRKLAMNTIPPGFIYIQMPNQTSPQRLWPRYDWVEVSDKYPGLFFRVVGGNAHEFGQIQEGGSPKLNGYRSVGAHGIPVEELKTHEIQADDNWTGTNSNKRDIHAEGYPVSFKLSSEEVRPRNMAIKIWKRV